MSRFFYGTNTLYTGTCSQPSSGARRDFSDTSPEVSNLVTLAAGASFQYIFTSTPGVANWAAGNYIITLNVISANANISLSTGSSAHQIQGMLADCSNSAGLISNFGWTQSLASTGTFTTTVSGSALAGATTSSQLQVQLLLVNSAMNNQSATYSLSIETPISAAPASDSPRTILTSRTAITRASRW